MFVIGGIFESTSLRKGIPISTCPCVSLRSNSKEDLIGQRNAHIPINGFKKIRPHGIKVGDLQRKEWI